MRHVHAQFEWQIMRHIDAAYNLARWFLGSGPDAEDVVQDSVLKAYRAFSSFRGSDGKTWFLQVVRNQCLRQLERKRREPIYSADEAMEKVPLTDNAGNPEATFIKSADAERVRAAVSNLPEVFREVLVLREFEDLSYSEISEVVGVPAGTVMSRLSRARAMLLASLRETEGGGLL